MEEIKDTILKYFKHIIINFYLEIINLKQENATDTN